MICHKTINLNVFLEAHNEADFPNPVELAVGLQESLPKEWSLDDDGGYSVRFVPTINNDAIGDLELQVKLRNRKIEKLNALLAQEQKLTHHKQLKIEDLELQVQNLIEKNDNQRASINTMLYRERELQKKYDDSLLDWKLVTAQRDDAVAAVDRLHVDLSVCQATNRTHLGEAKVGEEMVEKIVDAMEGAGYDVAGWGNDAELEELEASTSTLEDEIRATQSYLKSARRSVDSVGDDLVELEMTLDNASTEAADVSGQLDTIRTRR